MKNLDVEALKDWLVRLCQGRVLDAGRPLTEEEMRSILEESCPSGDGHRASS